MEGTPSDGCEGGRDEKRDTPATGRRPAWYAVHRGRRTGVFGSWSEVWASVKGYKGAVHRKFSDHEKAWRFAVSGSDAIVVGTIASSDGGGARWAVRSRGRFDDDDGDGESADPTPPPTETHHPPIRGGDRGSDGGGRLELVALGRRDTNGVATSTVIAGTTERVVGSFAVTGRDGTSPATRRRCELSSLLRALESVAPDARSKRVWSASREAIDCVRRYLNGWRRRGMRMHDGRAVADADLILRIDAWLLAHRGHTLALLLPGRGGPSRGGGGGGCPVSHDRVMVLSRGNE